MQKAPQKTVTSIIKGLHDSDIEGKYQWYFLKACNYSYNVSFVRSALIEGSKY